MRKRLLVMVGLSFFLLAAACSSTSLDSESPTDEELGGESDPVLETAAVPDVVGMNLQQAQDTLQAAGFFDLSSHDATGQGRFQILDRNWVVVDQSPTGGQDVDTGTVIELGAVMYGEE